jgi:hypothetical protein
MLGSYGPQQEAYTKVVRIHPHSWLLMFQFAAEESPSGMLARTGSYNVRSRVIDDDSTVWLDFEWGEFRKRTLYLCLTSYRLQALQGMVKPAPLDAIDDDPDEYDVI